MSWLPTEMSFFFLPYFIPFLLIMLETVDLLQIIHTCMSFVIFSKPLLLFEKDKSRFLCLIVDRRKGSFQVPVFHYACHSPWQFIQHSYLCMQTKSFKITCLVDGVKWWCLIVVGAQHNRSSDWTVLIFWLLLWNLDFSWLSSYPGNCCPYFRVEGIVQSVWALGYTVLLPPLWLVRHKSWIIYP